MDKPEGSEQETTGPQEEEQPSKDRTALETIAIQTERIANSLERLANDVEVIG